MFRYYIATGLANIEGHRKMKEALAAVGGEITYDWTEQPMLGEPDDEHGEELLRERALDDIGGVASADALVLLLPGNPPTFEGVMRGSHVELGAAIALGKEIFIVSSSLMHGTSQVPGERRSVFYYHPAVAMLLKSHPDDYVYAARIVADTMRDRGYFSTKKVWSPPREPVEFFTDTDKKRWSPTKSRALRQYAAVARYIKESGHPPPSAMNVATEMLGHGLIEFVKPDPRNSSDEPCASGSWRNVFPWHFAFEPDLIDAAMARGIHLKASPEAVFSGLMSSYCPACEPLPEAGHLGAMLRCGDREAHQEGLRRALLVSSEADGMIRVPVEGP